MMKSACVNQPDVRKYNYDDRTVGEWLRMIKDGEVALPDFQRSYVWKPEQATKYLSALLERRPTGVFMVLKCGEEGGRLPSRGLSGNSEVQIDNKKVRHQILDGQQRLTTLVTTFLNLDAEYEIFVVLESTSTLQEYDNKDPVKIEKVEYIKKSDTKRKQFIEEPQSAYEAKMIPARLLASEDQLERWCEQVVEDREFDLLTIEKNIKNKLTKPLMDAKIHYCEISSTVSMREITKIYIDTNQVATPVTAFDVSAAYAKGTYNVDIRKLIEQSYDKKNFNHYFDPDKEKHIPRIGEWMLKVACLRMKDGGNPPKDDRFTDALDDLLSPVAANGKGSDNTSKRNIENCDQVLNMLLDNLDMTLEFVADQCGISTDKEMLNRKPSPAFHVIAALQDMLNPENISGKIRGKADFSGNSTKLIEAYFWNSVFTNRYKGQANDALFEDFKVLKPFLESITQGENWDWDKIQKTCPAMNSKNGIKIMTEQLVRIDTRESYLTKVRKKHALAALILSTDPIDWATKDKLTKGCIRKLRGEGSKGNLDMHHIFPRKFLVDNFKPRRGTGAKEKWIDHGLNFTPLTKKTNTAFHGDNPVLYIAKRLNQQKHLKVNVLKERVQSHYVPYDFLINEEGTVTSRYTKFLDERAILLAEKIREVTRLTKDWES